MKDHPPGSLRQRNHLRRPDSVEDVEDVEDVQEGAVSVTMIHPGITDCSEQFLVAIRAYQLLNQSVAKGMNSRLLFIPAPVPVIVDAHPS